MCIQTVGDEGISYPKDRKVESKRFRTIGIRRRI